MIVAYLLTVLAAVAWTWKRDRRPLPLAVLTTGVVVLGYVLYDTFVPFPVAPFDWIIAAAGASLAAGVGLAAIPAVRRRLHASPLLGLARLRAGAPRLART